MNLAQHRQRELFAIPMDTIAVKSGKITGRASTETMHQPSKLLPRLPSQDSVRPQIERHTCAHLSSGVVIAVYFAETFSLGSWIGGLPYSFSPGLGALSRQAKQAHR